MFQCEIINITINHIADTQSTTTIRNGKKLSFTVFPFLNKISNIIFITTDNNTKAKIPTVILFSFNCYLLF